MGFPFEHGLRGTLATMRLCEVLGVDDETASSTYYASLLMYSGCTTDADIRAGLFRGNFTQNHTHRQFGSQLESLAGILGALQTPDASLARRSYEVVSRLPAASRFVAPHFTAMCEVAQLIAGRLGMPQSIHQLFRLLTERWDGKSILRRGRGDEIPLPLRILQVGRDAAYLHLMGDVEHVADVIAWRAGRAFDPEIAEALVKNAAFVLHPGPDDGSVWDAVLAVEPKPWLELQGDEIDRALEAIGAWGDLVSPHLTGHSVGVANLVSTAAELCGLDSADIRNVRRAGFIHDVGNISVRPALWLKAQPLNADEREQVRLHPYYTERIFSRSPLMKSIAGIGCAHHERLDGSGYHRGARASELGMVERLLAAASAFHNKTEPRAYRGQLSPESATAAILERARNGKLDFKMVGAVAEASGQPVPKIERPAGLTEREFDALQLLTRGMLTKQLAHELGVSPKTADHHIQNIYRKIGVSSRAGAILFAAEKGLMR
jgi:HD-GYP domain-containing protein (c-di-GMP phosphodiesterase class II)